MAGMHVERPLDAEEVPLAPAKPSSSEEVPGPERMSFDEKRLLAPPRGGVGLE